MYANIDEIRTANRAAGGHWFEQPCTAVTDIIAGRYWVEARPQDPSQPQGSQWYSAVTAHDDGHIGWVDPDNTRSTSFEAAHAQIDNILRTSA